MFKHSSSGPSQKFSNRRTALAVGSALTALTIGLSGCAGDAGGDGDLLVVDMAISTSSVLSAAPFAVANELGYFEDEGCVIGDQVEEAVGGANTLRSVLDGGLDMGEVATNAVIEGFLAGSPILAVGSSHQRPYDFTYAVMPDSGIDQITDMDGKIFGFTSPGSASEDLSYLLPHAAGMAPDSVERVPTSGMGGGIAMLEGSEVDAALMIPILYERNKDKFKIGFEALDVIEAYQKTVYIASEEFAEKHPEGVRCVLAALDRGMQYLQDDPASAAEIYADHNEDYEADELEQEIRLANDRDALVGGVGFNIEGLENVALARDLRAGSEAEVPWDEIFDGQFLPDGVATELPKSK